MPTVDNQQLSEDGMFGDSFFNWANLIIGIANFLVVLIPITWAYFYFKITKFDTISISHEKSGIIILLHNKTNKTIYFNVIEVKQGGQTIEITGDSSNIKNVAPNKEQIIKIEYKRYDIDCSTSLELSIRCNKKILYRKHIKQRCLDE